MVISEYEVKNAVMEMSDGTVPADAVVKAACARVSAMVKDELSENEVAKYEATLVYAAVLFALRDTMAADTSPAEVKAGDVSIKNGSAAERITELIAGTMEVLKPVLKAEGEVFTAIEWRAKP